jgi:hypothetical protein
LSIGYGIILKETPEKIEHRHFLTASSGGRHGAMVNLDHKVVQ